MTITKTLTLVVTTRMSYIALLLALFSGFADIAAAQNLLQTSLAIVPNPPKKLSDWRTNRDAVQLFIINNSGPTKIKVEAKLLLNGTLVAMTKRELMSEITIQNGQTILYGSDLISEQSFSSVGDIKQSTIRTGILPEGTYEFCVNLLSGPEFIPVSDTRCGQFIITQYLLPQLVLPENEKELVVGMEKLIMFRWTPMIPAPSVPMAYRLRAVEVFSGQTTRQAFANNPSLFEKKVYNVLQAIWPSEIILPPGGITIAWSIQPEDLNGSPYVTPEGYPPPSTLRFLQSNEECMVLLEKLKYSINTLLAMEERYWQEYELLERAEYLQEEAEDRGDAYEVEHWQTKLVVFSNSLENVKERYEAAYSVYEEALKNYKGCTEQVKQK
jgi:hypothetical protein